MGAEQHRRGHRRHLDRPRRRPARLLAAGVRRGRPDDAARAAGRDARQERDRAAAPGPVLGARPAVAPTSSTPTAAAPTRCSRPDTADAVDDAVRPDGGRAARRSSATASRASSSSARWTPASSARRGRRRSSTFPGGTIDAAAIATMIESFHVAYEQRTGNRFDALPVQGVTYRVQAKVPIERSPIRRSTAATAAHPTPGARSALRYIYGEEVERARVRPRQAAQPATSSRARRSSARSSRPRQVCPGQTATVGRVRRDRDREGLT